MLEAHQDPFPSPRPPCPLAPRCGGRDKRALHRTLGGVGLFGWALGGGLQARWFTSPFLGSCSPAVTQSLLRTGNFA